MFRHFAVFGNDCLLSLGSSVQIISAVFSYASLGNNYEQLERKLREQAQPFLNLSSAYSSKLMLHWLSTCSQL